MTKLEIIRNRPVWLLLALLFGSQAQADLMLSGQSTTWAFGTPISSQEQIWVKETQVRRDFNDRGRQYTQLFDLTKKQAVMLDHFARTAEVYDLAGLDAGSEASAPSAGLKLKIEPTGSVRPLQKWNCREHDLVASIPARLGNEESQFHLKGRLWIASNVPEQSAIKELAAAAKKPGFFLAIPALARVAPAQSRVMSETIRKMASKGLPCTAEFEGSYEGNGPMVNLARKLPARAGLQIQQYSTDPIKPELFELPSGYRLMQKALPANLK